MPQVDEVTELGRRLEKALIERGAPLREVVTEDAVVGPSIIQIPLVLDPGTKFNDVHNIEDDVAGDIGVTAGFRLRRYIGRPHCAVAEIPRSERVIPHITDLDQPRQIGYKLMTPGRPYVHIALGTDMSGVPYAVSLDDLPHLLVAGATGSGKSYFLRSLLYQLTTLYRPDDVELVIIDGKGMTDFLAYEKAAHIQDKREFCRDPEAAPDLLEGLVKHRLREKADDLYLESSRVYEHTGENVSSLAELYAVKDDPGVRPMVVIIDEFAEIAMASGKQQKFLELMQRFAHHGRAVGAHLIAATQRPSVDTVPGELKANFARLAFRVQSRTDSQVVLDEKGAEQLLGQGDMLFRAAPTELVRLQGFDVR